MMPFDIVRKTVIADKITELVEVWYRQDLVARYLKDWRPYKELVYGLGRDKIFVTLRE